MKVTKEQLRKIIQEELQEMVDEDQQVDEVFGGLGKIFSRGAQKAADLATTAKDKAKSAVDDVQALYKQGEEEAAKAKKDKLTGDTMTKFNEIVKELSKLGMTNQAITTAVTNILKAIPRGTSAEQPAITRTSSSQIG